MKAQLKKIFNHYISKFGWQLVHHEKDHLYNQCISKIHSLVIADSNLASAYYFFDLSKELIIREILAKLSIDYIIDVGANEGQFYKSVRNSNYIGKGISFEPTPQSFDKLNNITEGDPDWMVYCCALGDCTQRGFINLYEESVFNSLNEINANGENLFSNMVRAVSKQEVKIDTLDNFISEHRIDLKQKNIFIKTDTQGYDLKVLKGANQILSEASAIQVELAFSQIYDKSVKYDEIFEFLKERGFQLTALIPISINPNDFNLIECDGIFTRSKI